MPRNMSDIHPFQVFLKDLAGMRRIVHFSGHIVSSFGRAEGLNHLLSITLQFTDGKSFEVVPQVRRF